MLEKTNEKNRNAILKCVMILKEDELILPIKTDKLWLKNGIISNQVNKSTEKRILNHEKINQNIFAPDRGTMSCGGVVFIENFHSAGKEADG